MKNENVNSNCANSNNNANQIKKRHNPKSYAPAVYIPCWLAQIPHNELSFGAKLLYGRLAQWSNTAGVVYRSAPQLSKEMGMGQRTIEKFIKELKDCNLIGTYHPQAGGSNHFEFYDHEWMHRELIKELGYDNGTLPPNLAVPPAPPCGTPTHDRADINRKEINHLDLNPQTPLLSSLPIVIDEDDPNTLPPQDLLAYKELTDTRTDEDYLAHCAYHIDKNVKKGFSEFQAKKGLIELLMKQTPGNLFVSPGYKAIPKRRELKPKLIALSIEEMMDANPFGLPRSLIDEWLTYRKKPITVRVWNQTVNVLMTLYHDHNISPLQAFEHMLERQWQGIEVRYFDEMVKSKKKKDLNFNNMDYDLGIKNVTYIDDKPLIEFEF